MFDNLMDDTPTSSSEDELQCYLSTDVEDVKDDLNVVDRETYNVSTLVVHGMRLPCDSW